MAHGFITDREIGVESVTSPGRYDGDDVTELADVMGTGAAPAVTDFDNDGINDEDEFTNGTDPTSDDTDGDGLKDNVETGTGEWVSAEDTGTATSALESVSARCTF